ncbi:major outer membrane protein [Campylobacter fetus]|uniref:Membrane protein n=1 Tax=Campylobacter fetus subsp. testudinum TaxID=1507806 RepID=A0AAX0HB05_CAMFE|nr:major outer membrane protein [Campylobacter fetus]AVK80721.1 major outer membrane protein [Campylobacter fetus subsp. testudinum]EAK0826769.1 major outer membrane protein [Campylobacter fetus]MPB72707.1 major outer membrane protein [Campylobacter fetus]MPB76790.1 major outer membrane protein [Campylobacter fetus]OCR87916.1 membrane protein [Campylobacter fetus subsp. testudinum]
MKLVKMSLAAIVAAGALTSVASATPLEEAIKNVDVSGFARYRFDSTKVDADANQGSDTKASHRFTSYVDFKTALDDNFFAVLGLRYDSKDVSGDHITGGQTQVGVNDAGAEDFGQTFNVRQFLLGYKAGNTTIQAGRQVVGTFFTDDMVGTGIKILNTDITGLTLAAVAFDDLQNDPDIGSRGLVVNGSHTYQNNLYGVAAIGSYDPVSFQLWYAMLENVTDLYAIDVAVNFNATADLALGLHGQFGGSSIDSDFKNGTNNAADDATLWAIEATAEGFGIDFSAGYIDFSADKDKVSVVSYEDAGSFIKPGEDLLDYTLFAGENKYWFITAGYSFLEKYRVGIDYIDGENKTNILKTDKTELVGRVDYAYSKKLNFKAWWSHITEEPDNAGKDKTDHFRFEAKYSF